MCHDPCTNFSYAYLLCMLLPTALQIAGKSAGILKKMYKEGIKGGESLDAEDAFGDAMRAILKTETEQWNNGIAIMDHSFKQDGDFQFQFGPFAAGGDLKTWTLNKQPYQTWRDNLGDGVDLMLLGTSLLNDVKVVLLGSTTGALFMASQEYAHRDVHPSNILIEVDEKGHITRTYKYICCVKRSPQVANVTRFLRTVRSVMWR